MGCRLWGCTESDTTEATQQQQQQQQQQRIHLSVKLADTRQFIALHAFTLPQPVRDMPLLLYLVGTLISGILF